MTRLLFTNNEFTLNNDLTIERYFSVIFDPIEQYDLSWLYVLGYNFYPVYFHICLIMLVLIFVISKSCLTIFGYINFKLYNFIKEAFLAVCGLERQILFPYFYYIFLFLLISNVLGMFLNCTNFYCFFFFNNKLRWYYVIEYWAERLTFFWSF